jgi:hypothetical protein
MDRPSKSVPLAVALALSCGFLVNAAPRLSAAEPDPPKGEEQTQDKQKQKAPPQKPLRFTDDDLEKYKKPQPPPPSPADDTDAAAPQGSAKPSPPAPPKGSGAGPKGPVPAAAPAKAPAAAKPAGPAGNTTAKSAVAVSTTPPNVLAAAAKAAASKPAAPKEPPDPLQQWKDREAKDAVRDRELGARRERIAGMESRLKYLQDKRLAILDPLRIMPKAQNETDASADASKGARDLLKDVEAEIDQVQKDLDAAREELVTTETRFAQESGRP